MHAFRVVNKTQKALLLQGTVSVFLVLSKGLYFDRTIDTEKKIVIFIVCM